MQSREYSQVIKRDFKADLKFDKLEFLTVAGRLFHIRGPEMANAVAELCRRSWDDEVAALCRPERTASIVLADRPTERSGQELRVVGI